MNLRFDLSWKQLCFIFDIQHIEQNLQSLATSGHLQILTLFIFNLFDLIC